MAERSLARRLPPVARGAAGSRSEPQNQVWEMKMDEGVVLLIASGNQRYREYLLAGVSRKWPIWLLDPVESTWQKPYVVGTTVVPFGDADRLAPDVDGLIAAAREIARQRPVRAAFTYDETHVVPAAHVAAALGLPGPTVDGAENCRNKRRSREVLTAAGVPQPRFAMVGSLEAARAAANEIGYPLVLKPQGMAGSIGVVRVDSEADLAASFGIAYRASFVGNPNYEGGVLVEEMVSGPEISIDGISFEGEYEPLFLARKAVGLAPYFEETGHVIDPADPLLRDADLLDVLVRAHRALGVRDGITHTEVMLTKRGPVIIEVNGRLGGDLIPYVGQLATGLDPGAIAADIAAGVRPTLEPTEHRVVGIRFEYPPQDCRVVEIALPEPGSLPGLLKASAMVPPGKELRLPPKGYMGRYAYVICAAADPAGCDAALDAAAAAAVLRFEEPVMVDDPAKVAIG
jgi:biotin carboxylase